MANPLSQTAPLQNTLSLRQGQEELYLILYLDQEWSGKRQNQDVVINSPLARRFGLTVTNDWDIYDGPDPSTAKIVARARGHHVQTSMDEEGDTCKHWFLSCIILFMPGSCYPGSTLAVKGLIDGNGNGEWAIVGGTGKFTLAQGAIYCDVVKHEGLRRIKELHIGVLYTPMERSTLRVMFSEFNPSEIDDAIDNGTHLGSGGYGDVYKAEIRNMTVAVKIHRFGSRQGEREFNQEGRQASKRAIKLPCATPMQVTHQSSDKKSSNGTSSTYSPTAMMTKRYCLRFATILATLLSATACLDFGFYDTTCPAAETIVQQTVAAAFTNNSGVAPALIRMHFHDCFVRGCDGSVLIDSTANNTAEKDSAPNNPSLRFFDVVDRAKAALEAQCPGVVSCADILAFAARDSVALTGGLGYQVPAGRRDGRISTDTDALNNLSPPFFNATQLAESFASKNLTVEDLVVLSGAHTIGVWHCSSFAGIGNPSDRLYNFSGSPDGIDPALSKAYAFLLKSICPSKSSQFFPNTTTLMDIITPESFDNKYYVGQTSTTSA